MEFPDVHGVYDYAGPSDNSRLRCRACGLPQWVRRRRPVCKFSKLDTQPILSPVYASLDTSQRPVQNLGPSGLLVLSRKALSFSTPCRFIPVHHDIFSRPRFEVAVEEQNPDGFPSIWYFLSQPDPFEGGRQPERDFSIAGSPKVIKARRGETSPFLISRKNADSKQC
jgi:hypothetical protein